MPEPNNQAQDDHGYIQAALIPELSKHMHQGAMHYGPNNHTEMGLRGQFADMYRKFRPLKRRLWDDLPEIEGKESTREICMDLAGHCLLTIAMIDRQSYVSGGSFKAQHPLVKQPVLTEGLRAAGWTRDESGSLVSPAEVRRGPEFRRVSVRVNADGYRFCSNCDAQLGIGQHTCNCLPL